MIAQRAGPPSSSSIIGGKKIHPVAACPAASAAAITAEQRDRMVQITTRMVEFAKFTIQVFDDVVLGNKDYVDLIKSDAFTHKTYNMGLVDANNKVNFYDGKVRVVGPDGKEHAKFERQGLPGSTSPSTSSRTAISKYPYLKKVGWKGFVDGKDSGVYKATPLSRLNASDGMATPLAQAEYERFYSTLGGKPVHATLATHWARVVELRLRVRSAPTSWPTTTRSSTPTMRNIPTGIVGEGVGMVEAPRGTLYASLQDRRERHRHRRPT